MLSTAINLVLTQERPHESDCLTDSQRRVFVSAWMIAYLECLAHAPNAEILASMQYPRNQHLHLICEDTSLAVVALHGHDGLVHELDT